MFLQNVFAKKNKIRDRNKNSEAAKKSKQKNIKKKQLRDKKSNK